MNSINCEEVCNENAVKTVSTDPLSSRAQINNKLNKSMDTNTNEDITKSHSLPSMANSERRETPRYRKVESRYKQSAQDWASKRTDDSHTSQLSRVSSRNPTPNAKTKAVNASTPLSTDKSLNLSEVSVINKVKEFSKNNYLNRKKYGKGLGLGLTTGRQLIALKRLPFGSDVNKNPNPVIGQTVGPIPMIVSQENETKAKEISNSLIRSTHLEIVFMNLKANRMRTERKANAFNKMSQLWSQTNRIRTELLETQKCLISLQNTIDSIELLDKEKTALDKYLSIRSKMDSLFICLSELIVEQKLILKIKNCDQNDLHELNEFLEISPKYESLDSFENLSIASMNIENSIKNSFEFESLEKEFKECFESFLKCFKCFDKFERIENSINPQKSLSIKKLF